MKDEMESNGPDSVDEDSFPILEGEKMCPRCEDCQVAVVPCWKVGFGFQAIRSALGLRGARGAWFCKGGCIKKGEHKHGRKVIWVGRPPRGSRDWSFIGWGKAGP